MGTILDGTRGDLNPLMPSLTTSVKSRARNSAQTQAEFGWTKGILSHKSFDDA
jgi:hypothetical protein